jgi:hypothetical protein
MEINLLKRILGRRTSDRLFILDILIPILQRNGAVIAGGMIVQVLLEETWVGSDVDIYVPEENFETLLSDLQGTVRCFNVISSPNYHNSFMKKNNIVYLAESKIDSISWLGDPIDQKTISDLSVNTQLVIDPIHQSLLTKYFVPDPTNSRQLYWYNNFLVRGGVGYPSNLQIMAVKKGVAIESVIGSFDLTFCQVLFDGVTFKTCGDTTMEDILEKKGKLNDDYYCMFNAMLYKRMLKYHNRGFTIEVDWKRVSRETLSTTETMSEENYLCLLMGKKTKKIRYFHRDMPIEDESLNRFSNLNNYSNLLFKPENVPDIHKLISLIKIQNLLYDSPRLTAIVKQYGITKRIITTFIDELGLSEEIRPLADEIFLFKPGEQYLFDIEKLPRRNELLFEAYKDFNLRPSEDCWLVGASALCWSRGQHMKPTYLIQTEHANGGEFKRGSKIEAFWSNYIEYTSFNILFVNTKKELAVAAWPFPCMYYDGIKIHGNTFDTTIPLFLRWNWSKLLRKSTFLTHEFKGMMKVYETFKISKPTNAYKNSWLSYFIGKISFDPIFIKKFVDIDIVINEYDYENYIEMFFYAAESAQYENVRPFLQHVELDPFEKINTATSLDDIINKKYTIKAAITVLAPILDELYKYLEREVTEGQNTSLLETLFLGRGYNLDDFVVDIVAREISESSPEEEEKEDDDEDGE